MNKEALNSLYAQHTGKVSDKWSLYLTEYDRALEPYRDKPIRLLEIGIQNGGSLEIWSKYFSIATSLIGCDINSDCINLNYDDPRINVIVGDANAPDVRERIFQISPEFDIIIDDGSHLSSDIIKSFALYFPHLANNGIFIVEDLHCSYWSQYQGGLFDPHSSISFFKRLTDIISHEHWGIPRMRADVLKGIFAKYDCEIDEEILAQVHSVEFINSMCIIRKTDATKNRLGYRTIAGSIELVVPGHLELHNHLYQPDLCDQSQNPWTARTAPPGETIQYTEQQLADAQDKITDIAHQLEEKTYQLEEKTYQLGEKTCQLEEKTYQLGEKTYQLEEKTYQLGEKTYQLEEKNHQIENLHQVISAYRNSTSWRVTKPLRFIGQQIRRIKKILIYSYTLLSNFKEVKRIILKLRNKKLSDFENYLALLQSEEYATQFSRDRGLSPAFLKTLIALGNRFFQFKRWWLASNWRRKYSENLLDFFAGKTMASKSETLKHICIHIDQPNGFFKILEKHSMVSGWGVDFSTRTAAKMRVRIGKVIYQTQPKQREDVRRSFVSTCQLPLDLGFAITIPSLSIGMHRLWIEVEKSDGVWIPVRRTLLLRLPRFMSRQQPEGLVYKTWCDIEKKNLQIALPEIKQHIEVMINKPVFTIIIDPRQNPEDLSKTISSINHQIYPNYELRVLPGFIATLPSTLKQEIKPLQDLSLEDIFGDFIIFIKSGENLAPNALYEFANAINHDPTVDLIYGDEDRLITSEERDEPFYKPDWSPDYLETFNYIGFPACFRTAIARGCFDYAHLYDLTLKFTEHTTNIAHIAKILGHKTSQKADDRLLTTLSAQNINALNARLIRTGRQGTVYEHELHPGCYCIEPDLKREPLVSIIIPTAGKTVTIDDREVNLITNVIGQIRNLSTYKNIEIIVVDNGDLSTEQQQALINHHCRQITYAESEFNIAKKLNLGVSLANGELLLLMNDDIEILTPSWIEKMVMHFEKPHVGVVGAKLLYPDGLIQHIGVVHNFGNPDHPRRLFSKNDAGYYFSACGVRNFMAVTGAVMMTLSNLYRQVGGYSEELAVSFNDVDYCLKVLDKKLTVVCEPAVELTHMESQSRIPSADINEVSWYHKRWASVTVFDPYYNEQFLTVAPPTFEPHVNQRML